MPRQRKPPRLLVMKDGDRHSWIVRDNGRNFRTGIPIDDQDLAKERLAQYVSGDWTPDRSRPGYIYYVTAAQSDDYPVKIGYSTYAISQRMGGLQSGNPNVLICLATEIGPPSVERDRHARFRHLHIRGEWFRRDVDLMSFIETISPQKVYA